jgi:ribosomal silencing factor RsfS
MKAQAINILHLKHVNNAIADYAISCSGISKTQIDAIAKTIVETTYRQIRAHS